MLSTYCRLPRRIFAISTLSVAVLFAFPIYSVAQIAGASSFTANGQNSWNIGLSPNDHWFSTKIYATTGSTVIVFANGSVRWAPGEGTAMSNTVGPNGTRPPFDEDRLRFPIPEAGCGALLMRIGNSKYLIGENRSIRVNEPGYLEFMVNDDYVEDNLGRFNISVQLRPNNDGFVLFSSEQDGNQEIYKLDVVSKKTTNITQSRSDDGYPRVSLDGTSVAFASNRDGFWDIYLMDSAGIGQRSLSRNRDGNGYMDWSPNGESLVFASTRNAQSKNDLYIIRRDGTGLRRLTNHPSEDVHPAWSPDGKSIAFGSERDGNRQIYVMNSDGTMVNRLMTNRWYDDYPAWSRDGAKILFSSDRDSHSSSKLDIYVCSRNGSNIQRLTSDPGDDRHPSWSPDGTQIIFVSNRDGDHDIFTMNADGTNTKKIYSAIGNEQHPVWASINSNINPGNYEQQNEWQIQFDASEMWYNTGVIIKKGQWISISASGRYVWNPNRENNNTTADPAGVPYNAFQISNPGDFPIPSASVASLVMRIGNVLYPVGRGTRIRASDEGSLQLMVNDRFNGLSDNRGNIYVVVGKSSSIF